MENVTLKNPFDIKLSKDYEYIRVTVSAPVNDTIGFSLSKSYTELGAKHNVFSCLIDLRNTYVIASPINEYIFAYKKREKIGLDSRWKVAILKKKNDNSANFFETVMCNSGLMIKSFEQEKLALDYLQTP